ncbi:nadph-cytochrome p450 reductase [Trichoderma arundinaceum]|uniref:NADPH--cytochrome P450 reductase n=1 Tax=Trichoderma arundinaceum TaxID=490622 RepID=A0A395NVL9_TRIAR|nr:nadph-cytochrome p450 reductase [Trichoderma arundinaceum]
MPQVDLFRVAITLIPLLLGSAAYCAIWRPWSLKKDLKTELPAYMDMSEQDTRNFIKKMEQAGKNCVVFYGSQSGNAEDYAFRLAQEGKSCYGLDTMVADLEDYDYDNLDEFPGDKVAIFVLATYGEGEPTDNAVDFYNAITDQANTFSDSRNPPLGNFQYAIFGLGNSTYEHYNLIARSVNKALEYFGAQKLAEIGEGNDGTGTMEEDFLVWKDGMWAALSKRFNLKQRAAVYNPIYSVITEDTLTDESREVYVGEPNKMHLEGTVSSPFNAQNPYIASVTESYELLKNSDRNCLHLEIDISNSNLSYQTGDHIAIWPINAEHEVSEFLQILGLERRRKTVISITALDSTAKVPFPTPTTFDTLVRYRLEICAPVSRQFLGTLAQFAPNTGAKLEIAKLSGDKDYFQNKIGKMHYNIARTLNIISGGEKWTKIPFSALIEGLTRMQPRYYSISSSALTQPDRISITVVVEKQTIGGRLDPFMGVATNYLLALKQRQNAESDTAPRYEIMGPRDKYRGSCIPIHIRTSSFRLPRDSSQPVILIGPGTGVAPMRAFVQERASLAQFGHVVGRTLLFFGCRRREEDYLYESEWLGYKEILGNKFDLITAFSREGTKKIYVQHRLKDYASEINNLLEHGAYIYVCGDATNMSNDVKNILSRVISKQRGITLANAEDIVKTMKATGKYLEDVW